MDKYKNKFRIPSARLKGWDYGNNGAYFITICAANYEHYLSAVQNGIMQLNEIGMLAEKYWIEIPNHFPFVELGNFVIMPNHTHGILIINESSEISVETLHCKVSRNTNTNKKEQMAKITPKAGSISTSMSSLLRRRTL